MMKSQFYERYWKHQDRLDDFFYKWPVIRSLLPRDARLRFLDFGCGTGFMLKKVLSERPSYIPYGVDVSGTALSVVKKRIPNGIFKRIEENQEIPFTDNYFDFILASDVLEHIYETEIAFKELSRVLKKNGKILVTAPYNGKLKVILATLVAYDQYFDPYSPHIRFFSPSSLARCLDRVGLVPTKRGYFGRFFPLSNGMYTVATKK